MRELTGRHLHLFGGEDIGDMSIVEECAAAGVEIDWVDLLYSPSLDLLRDSVYLPLLAKAKAGAYDSAWAAFPCGAFCHSRWKDDGGAPPLYSTEYPRGRPGLGGRWQVELLDCEELLYRTCTLLSAVVREGGSVAGETPVSRREPGWPWSRWDRPFHMCLFEHPLWKALEKVTADTRAG